MWRALFLSPLLWIANVASASSAEALTIPFVWSDAEMQGRSIPHAAMLVPLDAKKKRGHFLQFDTGAERSLLYSWAKPELQRAGAIADSRTLSVESAADQTSNHLSVELRGYGVAPRIEVREIDHGAEGGPVGTLGADFVDGSLLAIDYPRQRIYVLRGAARSRVAQCLFKEAAGPVDIELIGNRVGLAVNVAGTKVSPVLFDTGTSGFGLVLFDRSTWDALRSAKRPPVTTVVSQESSLQGAVSIASKLIDGRLCVGEMCIRRPEVGSLGFQAVPGFVGTIGNRDFASGFVAIDYLQRKALISRSPIDPSRLKCIREAAKRAKPVEGKG